MSIVFYKPGKVCKVKGIPCSSQVFAPEGIDFEVMKKAGWFKSIAELKKYYERKLRSKLKSKLKSKTE